MNTVNKRTSHVYIVRVAATGITSVALKSTSDIGLGKPQIKRVYNLTGFFLLITRQTNIFFNIHVVVIIIVTSETVSTITVVPRLVH